MKKILSWLIVVVMIIGLLPTAAFAAEAADVPTDRGECGESLTWELKEGILTIRGTGDMANGSYSTKSIWSKYADVIKTVKIEEGVTTVGNYAFYGFTAAQLVILPKSITRIGSSAFYNFTGTVGYCGTQADWANVKNTYNMNGITPECNYGRTDIAKIDDQPEGGQFAKDGSDADKALVLKLTKPDGLTPTVKWYVSDKDAAKDGKEIETGVSVSADGKTAYCTPNVSDVGTKYYYCVITSAVGEETVEVISKTAKVEVVESADKLWDGRGTASKPFLLKTGADLSALSRYVAGGNTCTGTYFCIENDITLPDNWTPIGSLKEGKTWNWLNMKRDFNIFQGNIDGKNHTVTVPEGSQTMLGAVSDCTISNLKIYGKRIEGFGVVDYYCRQLQNITIDNVTLLSGTHTKYSGFIGGYASGANTVIIRNSVVEKGVVIGDDGTYPEWAEELKTTYKYGYGGSMTQNDGEIAGNDMIGSFGGAFNGTIENCVSYAKVYGRDFVGGIMGHKGQSMGDCKVINCTFAGEVHASGNFAGGIMGAGYYSYSAPNTPAVTIQNCKVTGFVEGKDYVGGILGIENLTQCWDNGIGHIEDNAFFGTLKAGSDAQYVAAIIGYMRSINKYINVSNNIYAGDYKGIGFVKYVDTSCATHETQSGAIYYNTSESLGTPPSECNGYSGNWKADHNRTDDPLGADVDKMYKKVTFANVTVSILNAGSAQVSAETVLVLDRNDDGKIDVDEVLYAAHEQFYTGGAAAGYATATGDYGLYISKLWGVETSAVGYWLNDSACNSLSDKVNNGDNFVAFIYADKDNYSDKYVKSEAQWHGKVLTLKLEQSGYDENWNTVFSPLTEANIIVLKDGAVADKSAYMLVEIGSGLYNIMFREAGTYSLVIAVNTASRAITTTYVMAPVVLEVSETELVQESDPAMILKIEKTSTEGLVDTYTIYLSNGTQYQFTVTNGAQGDKGDKGDKGDTGAQGDKGDKGDKGDTGAAGQNGADGKDGTNGKDGLDGVNGKDASAVVTATICVISLLGNIALAVFLLMKKKNN